MKLVIQRVSEASVTVDGKVVGEIGKGMLVLVGVSTDDTEEDVKYVVNKCVNMRIFDDEEGVMNRSIIDIDGNILAVSQFTLLASTRKGNRPSYIAAAKHDLAVPMYELFCSMASELMGGKKVEKGIFGADMKVRLLNDGPVTIVMDSKNK